MSKNHPSCRRLVSRNLLASAAAVALFGQASWAQAADRQWVGTGSNFWTNDINWGFFVPPGSADRARFIRDDPAVFRAGVLLDADRTIAALDVDGNSLLAGGYTFSKNNNALLTVTGLTEMGATGVTSTTTFDGFRLSTNTYRHFGASFHVLTNGATMTVAGLLEAKGTSQLVVTSGTLNAAGGIDLYEGAWLQIDSGGTLNMNSGTTMNLNGSESRLQLNDGFAFSPGTVINTSPGADIVGSSYIDIGNGGATTVNLNGADSLLLAVGSTVSDWGLGASGSAVVNLSNGAVANVQKLNISNGSGAASININSGAALNVEQALTMGNGGVSRFIGMTINGGILDTFSTANFNQFADVNLVSGTLRFRGATSVNTGGRIDITGGTLDTTNATLTINGGTLTKTSGGVLSNGSTLRVQAGGTATISNFFDIANGVSSGALVVTGSGSTYSSTGLSDWGRGAGSTALVNIDGSGIATPAGLRIGTNNGAATVTVASAGQLKPNTLEVGGGSTARTVNLTINGGTLTVNDANSSTTFNDKAVLNLQSGTFDPKGQVTFFTGAAANWSGGSFLIGSGKTLTVSGGTINRTISSAGGLSPGATLAINTGGTFTSTGSYSVAEFGAGTAIITGANSRLRTLSDFSLGGASAGQVGTVTTTAGGGLVVGDNASGFAVNVLSVGDNNPASANAGGKLTIANGSTLNHHFDAVIAPFPNTFGAVIVTGTNSRFDVGSNLYLGLSGGAGDLQVLAGGRVGTAAIASIASAAQSNSTVTVSGANSTLAIGTNLEVGPSGTATVSVNNAGKVTAVNAVLGANATGIGTINLAGAGSRLDVTGTLTIGASGTGTVNLSGGTLKAAAITRGANSTFSFTGGRLETTTYTGSLTQNGGTFAPNGLNGAGATTVSGGYVLNAGTVEVSLGLSSDSQILASGPVTLNGGNLALSLANYVPTLDDDFLIVEGSSVTGRFATVSGVSISPNRSFAVIYNGTQVRYHVAIPGDATLSDGVGFPDLVILAQNYNLNARQWVTGDFDGTGVTDFADLVILAQHYGQNSLGLPEGATPDFASDWALAQSMVPEPTAMLALPALLAVARRTRCR
jgi:T5SS/PEP-CTERM-associated repeat protein